MKQLTTTASALALAVGLGAGSANAAEMVEGTIPFPDPQSMQGGAAPTVKYDDLVQVKALDSYSEPDWVAKLVEAGKLPPVEERLPKKPLVWMEQGMADGIGVYGGVLRHVSGGRPQGWNWMAGQHQGWGGLSKGSQMCLLRTGPMWILDPERVEPLPRLATDWEWSDDGYQLTMNLLEGARWSDGDPFDSEDILFMWEDNIVDTNVPSRMQASALGEDVKLEALGPYQIRWTFDQPFPALNVLKMSYISVCPGPSHILKPLHPRYNSDATYDSYLNALPAERLPWVTMGPWVATEYKPDEIIIFRRNPYFSAVDSAGNQLPYLDEVQYKLSTWEDRTVQTAAGTADMTNMENPSIYLETLKKAQSDDFANSVYWGPRALHWRVDMNLSTTCGVRDERDERLRGLFRQLEFRKAVTHAVDREAAGQALVRGPFTHPFAGGLHTETEFYQSDMVNFFAYDPDRTKALFAEIDLTDSDGDGFVNWPNGDELDIVLGYSTQRTTDAALADSFISMMHEVGLNVIGKSTPKLVGDWRDTCEWDWLLDRGDREFNVPTRNLDNLSTITHKTPVWHQGTAENPQEKLDFEPELEALMTSVRNEPDPAKRAEIFREYNRIFTANVYSIGISTVPPALMMNKRIRNVPVGTPVLLYQWSEDNLMRERLWVPVSDQLNQLLPGVVPTYEN